MSQEKKHCSIASLGLLKHDLCLINIILEYRNRHAEKQYELIDDINKADLVIVNSDNKFQIHEWHNIIIKQPAPVFLYLSTEPQGYANEYYLLRPYAPINMIEMLEKIFKEKIAPNHEIQVFKGDETTLRRFFDYGDMHNALVVDDSPTVRKQLEIELENLNLKVDLAHTGEDCLEMLNKKTYDIVFLDVVLPGIDGYEVCKIIRKNTATKNTPVIMLSGKTSPINRVRGKLSGCSSYLSKPVDFGEFHKTLLEHLLIKRTFNTGKQSMSGIERRIKVPQNIQKVRPIM